MTENIPNSGPTPGVLYYSIYVPASGIGHKVCVAYYTSVLHHVDLHGTISMSYGKTYITHHSGQQITMLPSDTSSGGGVRQYVYVSFVA